jgi:hypothetical protein
MTRTTGYDRYLVSYTTINRARFRRRFKWRVTQMRLPTKRKRRLCARTGHPASRIMDVGETWVHTGDALVGHLGRQCWRCGAVLSDMPL